MDVVVGMGSNLGDSQQAFRSALERLDVIGQGLVVSSLYETDPVGPPQPAFLNAAVRLATDLPPLELLERLLAVERLLGRVRTERWGPRALDLDILWARDCVFEHPVLAIPHAELSNRAFAMIPLLDVAPEAFDPRTGVSYRELVSRTVSASVRRIAPNGWRDRNEHSS